MNSKKIEFLFIGVFVSFLTTILLGFAIYGKDVFLNVSPNTQVFMNALGGSLFFYTLHHYGYKVSLPILLIVLIIISVFHTHVASLKSGLRDALFFFALGVSLFLYFKFVYDKTFFYLRPIILALILGLADTLLFMGIQTIAWSIAGLHIDSVWMLKEFYFGFISGLGLGIGFEVVKLATKQRENQEKQ